MAPVGSKNAPEAKDREKTDRLLEQAGWVIQDVEVEVIMKKRDPRIVARADPEPEDSARKRPHVMRESIAAFAIVLPLFEGIASIQSGRDKTR